MGGVEELPLADGEIVEDIQETVRKPLLVGQIQSLAQIIADFQEGKYTYNQALNTLQIGIGLSKADAEMLLDKQADEIQQNLGEGDDVTTETDKDTVQI